MNLPTSNRAIPKNEHLYRYVNPEALEPSAPYGGWNPKDHFLSFETLTLEAKRIGLNLSQNRVYSSFESSVDSFRLGMDAIFQELQSCLNSSAYVIDQDGLEVIVEYRIRVQAKSWPAIPGITVDAK